MTVTKSHRAVNSRAIVLPENTDVTGVIVRRCPPRVAYGARKQKVGVVLGDLDRKTAMAPRQERLRTLAALSNRKPGA